MGQGLTLVGCGDSWAWGTELIDPTTIDRPDWSFNLHHLPINKKYREDHRYLKLFSDKIGATEIVDLSQGGCSNDTIVRTLIAWLTENDYMSGRDTSGLFVSIGWTSPERKDFLFKHQLGGHTDNWLTIRPTFYQNIGYKELEDFFNLYVENFWHIDEYMNRWINQIWQVEVLLKSLKIKYVMHQAFYHHHEKMITNWNDIDYIETHHNKINSTDLKLWNIIDSDRFINKNNPSIGTFHSYISNSVGKNNHNQVIVDQHPNALGHSIWADYMYKYCIENKLL